MRRSALAALLLPGIALLASCGGRDTSQPVEPSFAKVEGNCLIDNEATLYGLIDQGIDDLFLARNARKAAHEHLDNIVGDLCQQPRDWDAARQHLTGFVQQVAGQPDDQLEGEAPAWAELVSWTVLLADPTSDLQDLDPSFFEESGGLGIIDLSSGLGSVITRDRSARVTILKEDGEGPFIVAVTHKDGEIEVVSDHDGGFGQDGALVELCVPDGAFDAWVEDRIVLRHGSAQFLEPLASDICGAVTAMAPAPTAGTSWLGRVASWAGSAARTLFGPEPVRAMYFAGRGLGGLTGSFSPFTVVDPYKISAMDWPATITAGDAVEMTVNVTWPSAAPDAPDPAVDGSPTMEWSSNPDGGVTFADDGCELGSDKLVCTVSVTGKTPGDVTIEATYPGLDVSKKITVLPRKDTLIVTVAVETPGTLEITDNYGNTCSADDKWAKPTVCPWTYVDGDKVILTAQVHRKIEGSWDILASGLWPEDLLIPVEQVYSFDPFTMDGDHEVTFTLKH